VDDSPTAPGTDVWRPPEGPLPTADVIIEVGHAIVLVERRFEPFGWAIPGGFIERGESAEACARREALEETGLEVTLLEQFHVYSAPERDPRHHTLTVVFIGRAQGTPRGGDDAARAALFKESRLPKTIAFDHSSVLADYFEYKRSGTRPLRNG